MKLSERMKVLLLKKPPLFDTYNKFLDFTIKTMVFSLDHVIKHAAIIRSIDLQDPWKEARKYLSQNFDRKIEKEFSIPSYMDAIYARLKDPVFSKEDFLKATDLSKLNDHVCKCQSCDIKKPNENVTKKTTKKVIKKTANVASKKTSTAEDRANARRKILKAEKSK